MVREAILICALALPPLYVEDKPINTWIEQYHDLKDFIHRIHPGTEILITQVENPPKDPHWERLPFLWNGNSVWIKRHHIYDQSA